MGAGNRTKLAVSRSHYRDKVLPDNRALAQKYLDATASPCTTVFGLIPVTSILSAFMSDYGDIVFGWMKWSGKFAEWNPVVEYKARACVAMHDPTSPFHRFPSPYYMPVYGALNPAAAKPTRADYAVIADPNTPNNFDELFQAFLKMAPSKGWPSDPSKWPPDETRDAGIPTRHGGGRRWRRSPWQAFPAHARGTTGSRNSLPKTPTTPATGTPGRSRRSD